MSKVANMLNMLMLLRSRNKMKIKELSEKIEVKPRTIREYKYEFEQIGIYIGSKRGRYGGYYIERDNTLLDLGINEDDYSVLKNAEEYLKQEGFIFLKEFRNVLDKINSNLQQEKGQKEFSNLILQSSPNIDHGQARKKYQKMQDAFLSNRKVEMNYFSLSSGLNQRVIRPYAIYIYQGFWYIMAYCELRKAIRQFKLSRIRDLKLLDENFKPPKDFSLKHYLENTVGIVYDEDKFNVKLEIDFPMSIKVKERIWVKNQEITLRDDNSILFKAEMTGLDDLVNWVLSMGSAVKVISPLVLKEKVRQEAEKIVEKN